MIKFTYEDLKGEWSNQNWGFKVIDEKTFILMGGKKNHIGRGVFNIYEGFLNLQYRINKTEIQWTARIDIMDSKKLTLTDLTNEVGKQETLYRTHFDNSLMRDPYFYQIENLVLEDVKKKLGIDSIPLVTMCDKDGAETDSYWYTNNEYSFAIVIKKELFDRINKNAELPLTLRMDLKIPKFGIYSMYKLIDYEYSPEPKVEQFNYYDDQRETESDTFYALTDGQYGDYEDWKDNGGNMDDLRDFLGH